MSPTRTTLPTLRFELRHRAGDEYLVELVNVTREGKSTPPHRVIITAADIRDWCSRSRRDPDAVGAALATRLFAPQILTFYHARVGNSPTGRVRVELSIQEVDNPLHALPWELMHGPARDAAPLPLAADEATPFARFDALQATLAEPLPPRPLRLLVFVANPWDLDATGMDAVAVTPLLRTLLDTLAPHSRAGRLQVTVLAGVTDLPDALTAALHAAGWTLARASASLDNLQRHAEMCDLLYLTAHGRDDGLLLEADGGAAAQASAAAIADKVNGAGARPHLIFLAACYSGARDGADAFAALGPRLHACGVPAVVAMQDAVAMDAARQLAADFFAALLDPALAAGQVDLALNRARRLLYDRQAPVWAPPVLFCRLRDGVLFGREQPAAGPVPPRLAETLIGRTHFLNDLAAELPATPRLALRGPAGIGKTALALALANHPAVAAAFPDGRAWVALGPQPDLFTALKHLATAFGADAAAVQSVDECAALVRRVTADRRWLLVIDDIWATADALPLLAVVGDAACALMTTRSALIADDLRAANHEVFVLAHTDAVMMLAAAGSEARRAVDADPTGAAELAAALGGLPLALHVAGRQLNRQARADGAPQAVAHLHRRLDHLLEWPAALPRLGILAENPPLGAVLQLSYAALSPDLRASFRRLAVFGAQPLDFDAEAMQSVWDCPSEQAAERRATLVDFGLLTRLDAAPAGVDVRFTLHQVLYAYARSLLATDHAEAHAAGLSHAAHYARVVSTYNDAIARGAMTYDRPWEWEQVAWAVAWLAPQVAAQQDSAEALLAFARTWRNVLTNNYDPRRTHWVTLAVTAAVTAGSAWDQANTLQAQGDVYRFQDRNDAALAVYGEALGLFRQVGDRLGEANTLKAQGDVYRFQDRNDAALAVYGEALGLFRQVGDRLGEANTLKAQGDVYGFLKRNDAALAVYGEALGLFRQVGSRLGEANTLKAQGDVYGFLKRNDAALAVYGEALGLFRQVGDRLGEANTLKAQGDVYGFLKRNDAALAVYGEALGLFRQVGSRLGEANTLKAQGDVYRFQDRNDAALAVYGEALGLFRQVGDRLGEANTLQAQGDVYGFLKRNDAALAVYGEALGLFRQVGDRLGEANTLQAQGDVYGFLKRNDAALAVYGEALGLFRQVGDRLGEANTLKAQGDVYRFQDRNDAALAVYGEALGLFRQVGDRLGEANTLQAQGQLALAAGDETRALVLLEQAHSLYRAVGDRVGPANLGIILADAAAARGDLAAAIEYLQPAADFCRAIGHPLYATLQARIDGWRTQLPGQA